MKAMIKTVMNVRRETRVRFENGMCAAWWVMTTESPVYRSPTAAFLRALLTPSDQSAYGVKQEPDAVPESVPPEES